MTEARSGRLWWSPAPARPVVAAGEIHVFAFALEVPPPHRAEAEGVLSRDEAERAARFHRARDRDRYVAGRAQLRTILGRCLGLTPAELRFRYGTHGKPALEDAVQGRLRFNLSRSHDLGLLALARDDEIGVDVELVRPFPDALGVAQRFFAPAEHDVLRAVPDADRDAAFFSYWTRKEAVAKSLGLGLSQPMDGFVLERHPGVSGERVVVASEGAAEARWSLVLAPPSPGYVAALAAPQRRPTRCWAWGAAPAQAPQ